MKKNNQSPFPSTILLCCFLLIVATGCARKPWKADIDQDHSRKAEQVYRMMQKRDASCLPCLDGDTVVTLENHLETKSLSGYIQCMLPDSVKFIASNPLGQPLFALTSDGARFQSLNTTARTYTAGSLQSYALLHDIPPAFFSGSWGEWLTGRIDQGRQDALSFKGDEESRGIWVSFTKKMGGSDTTSHLLIDTQKSLLLSRILEDAKGKILAEINYADWRDVGGCRQPGRIAMSQLAFGGQVSLKLSNIGTDELCREGDFVLPVPAGYARQFLP
jgi:hypothetical protein